jgi:hypothetical protein
MIGIYKISCTQETVVYIGSSNNIDRRWKEHKRTLNNSKHHNSNLQLAWDAYGSDSFTFEIVENTTDLVNREQHWVDSYWPNCYNSSPKVWSNMANPATVLKAVESLRKSGKRGGQKLTEELVVQIKTLLRDGTSVKEIAEDFMISSRAIAAIKTGDRWGYVKVEGFVEGTNKTIKGQEPMIIKLYTEGVKVEKIKEICSLRSASSIYDVLKRNNIKPTRKPWLLKCPK